MQKYKYVILLLLIIVLAAGIVGCGITEDTNSVESNAKDYGDSRIPKLEEGVDVYALENEIFNMLGPDNVAITTDRSSGSGILWKYDGVQVFVVTARHMMTDFEMGEIEVWSGEKLAFTKEDVRFSTEIDVAVIRITCNEELKLAKGGAAAYVVENAPEIGDTMWVLDSVYGAASGIGTCQVSAVDIYLEDYGTEMLLLYGTGRTGMSGCPIYNEEGRLVAVMSGMSEDGSTLAAIPVGKIMKFLETLEA